MSAIFKNFWAELQLERAKVGRLEHTILELESRVEYQTKVNMDLYLDIVANGEDLDFAREKIHDTRETLNDTREELQVYIDMQENLNTNLAEYPHIIDALETLQNSVLLSDELESLYDVMPDYEQLKRDLAASEIRIAYYAQGLERCHNAYLAATQEAQDRKDTHDKWLEAYKNLK